MNRSIAGAVCLLSCLLFACDPGADTARTLEPPEWTGGPDGPRMQITVNLTERGQGEMAVSSWYEGFSGWFCVREMGKAPEYRYRNLKFSDREGRKLGYEDRKGLYCLDEKLDGPLLAEYVVEPGGKGRHGHQGIVLEDWAAFDGRAFLLPRSKSGLMAARLRFETPEGWSVASPFVENDGWYEVGGYRPAHTAGILSGSCFGLGPFVGTTRTIGSTEYRVFSYAAWDEALRERLETRSFAVFQWLYDNVGFELGGPYAAIWTPQVDGGRMFGGSHVCGTCFENPTGRLRSWQILTHRIGHSVNKYPPTGMVIRDEEDRWFKEGYASYIEVIATAATGAASDEGYWDTLYGRYRRDAALHPEWDLPLARESEARGETAEYLHYIKAPLVTKMLDVFAQERTGKDLQGFMKGAFGKYGHFQAPFPMKTELEAYLGIPLDDFWQVMIRGDGPIVPVWPEYYEKNTKPLQDGPAGTVGGVPLAGDYLFYLAASGKFARFADIEAFLVEEIENRRRLADLGLPVIPPEFTDKIPELPPAVRYDIARLEADWPKPASTPSPQTTSAEAAEPLRLELNLENPDGAVFHELLEDERANEVGIVRHGLTKFTARAGANIEDAKESPPVLGWRPEDAVVVQLRWHTKPASAKVISARGSTQLYSREIVPDPKRSRTRSGFEKDQRPEGEGIVTFVVEPDDGSEDPAWRVQRSFWQRQD